MEKISVSSMLSMQSDEITGNFFDFCNSKTKTIDMEVKEIKKINAERRKAKHQIYRNILSDCVSRIGRENRDRKTETKIIISSVLHGNKDYSNAECMEYIEQELMKYGFTVRILNPNVIYVSWSDMMTL